MGWIRSELLLTRGGREGRAGLSGRLRKGKWVRRNRQARHRFVQILISDRQLLLLLLLLELLPSPIASVLLLLGRWRERLLHRWIELLLRLTRIDRCRLIERSGRVNERTLLDNRSWSVSLRSVLLRRMLLRVILLRLELLRVRLELLLRRRVLL